eukprot:scaffold9106_cov50-Phaeocystis_antarctica.AAC.5
MAGSQALGEMALWRVACGVCALSLHAKARVPGRFGLCSSQLEICQTRASDECAQRPQTRARRERGRQAASPVERVRVYLYTQRIGFVYRHYGCMHPFHPTGAPPLHRVRRRSPSTCACCRASSLDVDGFRDRQRGAANI